MTPQEDHPFASADEVDLAYRSLSTPAVVALVLGLLSPLVFVTPTLRLLPLLGAVVSFFAARSVAAASESKTGLRLAIVGLCLSIGVAAADYARGVATTRLHHVQAEPVATEFLRRLGRRDTVGAIELTAGFGARMTNAEAARVYYESDQEAKDRLAGFEAKPAIAALIGVEPPALRAKAPATPGRFGRILVARDYDAPEGASSPVRLVLERDPASNDAPAAWRVSDFDFAD